MARVKLSAIHHQLGRQPLLRSKTPPTREPPNEPRHHAHRGSADPALPLPAEPLNANAPFDYGQAARCMKPMARNSPSVRSQPCNRIWTLVDGERRALIVSGFWRINRIRVFYQQRRHERGTFVLRRSRSRDERGRESVMSLFSVTLFTQSHGSGVPRTDRGTGRSQGARPLGARGRKRIRSGRRGSRRCLDRTLRRGQCAKEVRHDLPLPSSTIVFSFTSGLSGMPLSRPHLRRTPSAPPRTCGIRTATKPFSVFNNGNDGATSPVTRWRVALRAALSLSERPAGGGGMETRWACPLSRRTSPLPCGLAATTESYNATRMRA